MRLSHQIVVASTNREKFEEFSALIAPFSNLELLPAEGLVRNVQYLGKVEKYETYAENALAKARLINQACHFPTLADDTGLEVLALEGKPGVKSARFSAPRPGLTQDQANLALLLEQMKGQRNREARFVCTLALVIEGVSILGTGTLEGSLTETPRGGDGFGYDPIFVPKGASKTLAEMSLTEKNQISHRSKALQALLEQTKSHGIVFAKT